MNPVEMNFYGFTLLEPLTSLTDITTGLLSIFLSNRLRTKTHHSKSRKLFFYYFLFTGIATFCGGLFGHALLYYISWNWKVLGWIFGAIGLFFLENATIAFFNQVLRQNIISLLRTITVVQLLVYIATTFFKETRVFESVTINATFGYVLVIIPIFVYAGFSLKNRESWGVIFAIGLAALTGFIYTNGISINAWFNHHVLTHLAMSVFVFVMYVAVNRLLNSKIKVEQLKTEYL